MRILNFKSLQFLLFFLLLIFCTKAQNKTPKHTYIVHIDKSAKPKTFTNHIDWFHSSLKSVSNSAEILYTYKHITHGFSTRLTSQEANQLSKQQGILSITPEVIYKLHTTRTPQFLGLSKPSSLLPTPKQESQVIIGVLDTGIWPEHISLQDDNNLGSIPSNWKGECETGYNMNSTNCNKKLIGARFFAKGIEAALGQKLNKSARDEDGHGTHTLTTAAGSIVPNASLLGLASGTAKGMAPPVRVAAYKVCWIGGCHTSDIAAGIDKAIDDGVHIISMSLGGHSFEYYDDVMAIGGFSAMSRGIFVSTSAANDGPVPGSLSNVAPWLTTVGAGTIDRDFPAYVILGNGKNFTGTSLYNDEPLPDKLISVVYAGNVSNSPDEYYCMNGTLIPSKVVGKIVICEKGGQISRVGKGLVVKNAGGIGMILVNGEGFGEVESADAHLLPAAALGEKASNIVRNYVFSSKDPTARIVFGGTRLNVQPSPVVASFSSRGPNSVTPQILKPDLIAPGVNILAGWTGATGPSSGLEEDKRHVSFSIISGTSMSCPHVTGLAAILKSAHPEWSPAVIKSALMTTSYRNYKNGQTILDFATGEPATPFDFGAGHVDPLSALDPGLVYDADVDDYLGFLCGLNYTSSQIKVVAKRNFVCDPKKTYRLEDFNYPSFAVPLETTPKTVKYSRVLTNVGTPGIYKASVSGISKDSVVKILVEPETLDFKEVNEKKSYTVTFTCGSMPSGTNSFAYLEWTDGKHRVVSPIAISWT